MSTRPRTTVLVAALAVLALFAGLAGTATASGLTAKSVRKIATKVVKKQATRLSVAHAATADRATSADTAGRVSGFVYSLPTLTSTTTKNYTFPGLPAGTYLASYDFAANIPNASTLSCQFQPATGPTAAPSWSYASAGGFATAEGSSIVAVAGSFHLACTGSAAWSVNPYYGATVSFVPVSSGAPVAASES